MPIYSYTCSCQIKNYITTKSFHSIDEIFKAKYYDKYIQLKKQRLTALHCREQIPHIKINDDEKCPIHLISDKNDIYNDETYLAERFSGKSLDLTYKAFNEANIFEIGPWFASFAILYWGDVHYGWLYNLNNFSISQTPPTLRLSEALETKLLIHIQNDTNLFKEEISQGLASTNIIQPIRNIITDYSYSPLHMLGFLIHQLKNDINTYLLR
ncbi:MAG: hypothetical protein Harvfovirus6_6 [Harvfovirus sp.]|uniref:Uncharacterized protein n=1 Tax=Harvfovirus sp. TaxID=2487768 RepID=A0A3G5A0K6_9VIRU|nr:MAG: hypothetical protein Harvfovirus6_6 [Harvfovirus sp.]